MKNLLVTFLAFIICSLITVAQSDTSIDAKETHIYMMVESTLELPGGEAQLHKYLYVNILYPDSAKENGISGRVFIQFVIDEEGNVTNPKVIKGIEKLLDEEALRVVSAMPRWIPGKKDGKPVKVTLNLPIHL